jgi:ABC-type multidrug transport system ATPase subunit
MSILATVTKPSSGTFLWEGRDVVREPLSLRRELGYLPQDFGVYPKLTGREFLLYLGRLKGLSGADLDRRVQELLELTNLHGAASRRLGGYSGGMRQRIGIAQALLGDPRLVIVDEPTAGLDPEERNRFLNLLAGIGEQVIVILSTHIVEDVADLCPRMAIISRGQVLMSGEPREAIGSLRDRVWSKLVSKASLSEYQERYSVLSTRLVGGQPLIHVYSDSRPENGFEPVAAGLEDVYFRQLRSHGAAAHA